MSKIKKGNVKNVQKGIRRGIKEVRNILDDVTDDEIKAALDIEFNNINKINDKEFENPTIFKAIVYCNNWGARKRMQNKGMITYCYHYAYGCDAPDSVVFVPENYDIKKIKADSVVDTKFRGTLMECIKEYPEHLYSNNGTSDYKTAW